MTDIGIPQKLNDRYGLPAQPVDATPALILSAGDSTPHAASTRDKQTMKVRQTLAQSASAPLLASSGPTAPLSLPP